ncbi:MAG TPA: transposase, partial [Ktedonobacterales bacterium]|nr:transposase [Ktedonobacterales bacterium]
TTPSDVTDAQWERVASLLLLPQTRGRPYVDARRTLNGIRYVMITRCGWNHMPERYGNYVTCWRRQVRWQSKGVWAAVCHLLDHHEQQLVAQVIEQAKKS